MALLLSFAQPVGCAEPQIKIDTDAVSHKFLGFGIQIWPAEFDATAQKLLIDLDIDYVRFSASPSFDDVPMAIPIPKDTTVEIMDEFVRKTFSARAIANGKRTFDFCKQHGIRAVLLMWSAPKVWRPIKNQLLPEYMDDFARLWGSTLRFLDSQGMRPDYIELSNEPEGDWNTFIPPEKYNHLAKLVRVELNRRGLNDVKIVGPGVWAFVADKWINALDDSGLAALDAWSVHSYELPEKTANVIFEPFVSAAKIKDSAKLILVTEYSTKITQFNDIQSRSNDDGSAAGSGRAKASFTIPYAIQVFQNALVLINKGANSVFYWEASDHSWTNNEWGMIDRRGVPKPVYKVLSGLYPKIPDGADVLKKQWDDKELTMAAFKKNDTVIIALANITDHKVTRDISLSRAGKPKKVEVSQSNNGAMTIRMLESFKRYAIHLALERQSTATLVLSY